MHVQGYSATYEVSPLRPQALPSGKSASSSQSEAVQADCALCRHTSFPHSHESADARGSDKASKTEESPLAKERSEEDQKEVEKLKKRDQDVRQHEAAHKAAGGQLAGAPQLEYAQGPDGRQYATEGHVPINTSPGRTPEETLYRAATIRRAALAPQNPSNADRKVAAEANQMEAEARAEIMKENSKSMKNVLSSDSPAITAPASPTPKIEDEDAAPSSLKPGHVFETYEKSEGLAKKPQARKLDFLG